MRVVRYTARAAVALLLLPLAGCSGEDSDGQGRAATPSRLVAEIRLADCADWQAAGIRERRDSVKALRAFAGGPSGSPGGRGTVLDDGEAYKLLSRACGNRVARGFKLYKLYTRASAIGPR